MKFIHLFICSHSTFKNATCGWTHKAAGWALADEAVSLTSEVGLLLRKEDVFGGEWRSPTVELQALKAKEESIPLKLSPSGFLTPLPPEWPVRLK